LNFIFGIVCLFVCVCAFSLRRESPDMILGDKPLIFEVVLSQFAPVSTMLWMDDALSAQAMTTVPPRTAMPWPETGLSSK
jgi:hypothetical protein